MKKLLLIAMISILGGCAASYDGPGSFQDFANARYQCVQETSAWYSSGAANQYGASVSSGVKPGCSAFLACLASKGYYKTQNGRFDAKSIPVSCSN